jgi:hypothetical protein
MGDATENIALFDPMFRRVGPMKPKSGRTKPDYAGGEDILKPWKTIQGALGSDKPDRAKRPK